MKALLFLSENKKKRIPLCKLVFSENLISKLSNEMFGVDLPCPKQLIAVQYKCVEMLEHSISTIKGPIVIQEHPELKDILDIPKWVREVSVCI